MTEKNKKDLSLLFHHGAVRQLSVLEEPSDNEALLEKTPLSSPTLVVVHIMVRAAVLSACRFQP